MLLDVRDYIIYCLWVGERDLRNYLNKISLDLQNHSKLFDQFSRLIWIFMKMSITEGKRTAAWSMTMISIFSYALTVLRIARELGDFARSLLSETDGRCSMGSTFSSKACT
ncbi:hypothetical protein V1477_007794 [Vespula maculifrons]|uniref:Uncharacterized protein n=1 Tax=Vespula maculifrons TaxID=7453 RepID=A0ABD2CFR8_VESMC